MESIEGGLVVFEQLVAVIGIRPGRLFGFGGDGIFVAVADPFADHPVVDGVPHPLFVQVERRGRGPALPAVRFINIDHLEDAQLRFCRRLLGDQQFGLVVVGEVLLRPVLGKPLDVDGIHRGRTGIDGVEVLIDVEHDVVHGEGNAVGELQPVFDDEGVDGLGAVSRAGDLILEIFDDGAFVIARDGIAAGIGAQHTDLRHADDVHIRPCRGIEGIEQAAQFFRHDDDAVFSGAARGERKDDACHERAAHDDRQSSLYFFNHCLPPDSLLHKTRCPCVRSSQT